MDDIFLRELVVFAAIIAIFIGAVPLVLRGRRAPSIDATIGSGLSPAARRAAMAVEGDESDDDDDEAHVKVSRKRKARAREGARKLS